MDNPQSISPAPANPPFHHAALWSGAVMLIGLILGFHFELDPQGSNWAYSLLWGGGTFVVCWALSLIGLYAAYRHRMRILIFLPIFPLIAVAVWGIAVLSTAEGLGGLAAIVPLLILASAIPGVFFGMMVGLLVMRNNGWKLALGLTIIGVVWAGYQFTIPRGDTREQAIATGSVSECKKTSQFLRNDCFNQVAAATKDSGVCDTSYKKNSGDWIACYIIVAKAANNVELCIGPEGDTKSTCKKEIAINEKNLNGCDQLAEPYLWDCYRRVFSQLASPTPILSQSDVRYWCRAAKKYPVLLTNFGTNLQSLYDTYCGS